MEWKGSEGGGEGKPTTLEEEFPTGSAGESCRRDLAVQGTDV